MNTWFLELTLQNGYEKRINGIQLALGDVGIFTELMYNEDQMIPPGGTNVDRIAIQANTDTRGVTLLSVHFEDGTADGDELAIKQVDEGRAGQKTQIRRALVLIRRALRSPNVDSVSALDELRSQIQSLPSKDAARPDFSGGLASGKQRMIAIIDELRQRQDNSAYGIQGNLRKQPDMSIKTELTNVLQQHEKVVSQR